MGEGDPVMSRSTPPVVPGTGAGKLWREAKGFFWLIAAVLAFHSFVAKPFYIPSESMMPGLIKGDRLIVTKFPYGWSWVSLSLPFVPEMPGRVFGRTPRRGDIVILTPAGRRSEDWIKRVIGLPGDIVAVRDGQVILNGRPVPREAAPPALLPIDANLGCAGNGPSARTVQIRGKPFCRLPVFRETLPDGRSYDTLDTASGSPGDDFAPVRVPAGRVFLMGDNRDNSLDSRFGGEVGGLGGPVPLENVGGRAEFITFSLDGSASLLNPVSWFRSLRHGRAGTSLHPRQAAPAR
ncbi:MAG: signal peptidase I [Alphaproteobacteria bacterium]|nr:signal peptidase I [Alphaproteobacteria bacterium]MBV9371716.1 signal peptidase I [Alphaproteobacteria bacterium]MBV9902492.1 signal peptidase I [Alphaproteobacteria bacterium]